MSCFYIYILTFVPDIQSLYVYIHIYIYIYIYSTNAIVRLPDP